MGYYRKMKLKTIISIAVPLSGVYIQTVSKVLCGVTLDTESGPLSLVESNILIGGF